jgi:uncharacterized membrane protein HdeD (DUF308 family)
MTSNVGTVDRSIRLVLGIVVIALGLTHILFVGLATAAYIVAGIVLVTGVFRYCPAWSLFGINTCPLKSGQSK